MYIRIIPTTVIMPPNSTRLSMLRQQCSYVLRKVSIVARKWTVCCNP